MFIEFQSMVYDSDDFALYHQTKILINFWCKRRLNLKSFIQPSEILLVKLTEKKKLLINGGEYKSQSLVFFFWLAIQGRSMHLPSLPPRFGQKDYIGDGKGSKYITKRCSGS